MSVRVTQYTKVAWKDPQQVRHRRIQVRSKRGLTL